MRIDIHAHAVPTAYARALEREGDRLGVRIERAGEKRVIVARHYRGPADGVFADTDARLADLDRDGIDLQIVSPPAAVCSPWVAPDAGAEHARILNDAFAEVAVSHTRRLSAFGIVPLQAEDGGARELDRVRRDLRLPGVLLPTSVDGGPLDDGRLEPLYAAAAETGAVLFIHPTGPVAGGARLDRHGLTGGAGFPNEVAVAALELVLGGVLDRHPALRVLLAHGGGSLTWVMPRVQQAAEQGLVRGEGRTAGALPRFFYDTVVHDVAMLGRIVDQAGAGRVLFGTDHPAGLGDPGGRVALRALASLPAVDREAVLGGNAMGLMGLGGASG